jgi:hypothetical protein
MPEPGQRATRPPLELIEPHRESAVHTTTYAPAAEVTGPASTDIRYFLTEPLSRGCNTCRITGTVTFAGVSGYLVYQRSLVERSARGHRHALAAMAAGFAMGAVARWFA